MEQSVTNRSNRSKLSEPHCTRTRSFPRIVEDLTVESNGIPPTRADVDVRSRTRKDGNIVNSRPRLLWNVFKRREMKVGLLRIYHKLHGQMMCLLKLRDQKEEDVFVVYGRFTLVLLRNLDLHNLSKILKKWKC
ncbi:hypothetical protein HRI_000827900 [Hibiscus trionum]|uniref:Uncharacterized protein n=1 Tax=Hibiscus trionum TaxID=183268 RepID=A0A9W7LPS5_HIBTR|nr:hypothetical protein HRI_000827900 [Hibiscus trionum]